MLYLNSIHLELYVIVRVHLSVSLRLGGRIVRVLWQKIVRIILQAYY